MDLNADVGEGFGPWSLGDDRALLDIVTSANVACGFHAGDPDTMRRTCERAAARGVAVGAHVGYRDLNGFGRRFVDVAPGTLTAEVLYQLGGLDACARAAGTRVAYVKPHGALYRALVAHEAQADAVVDAVRAYDPALPVLGAPGAVWLKRAEVAGLPVRYEAFADRVYSALGTPADRERPGAVPHDPREVAARCVALAADGRVRTVDGRLLRMRVDSIRVHGGTPGAVAVARDVREALIGAGVPLGPFAGGLDRVRA
ncbi:LamB/YcsF family protein [Saccharothrix syringae]|uniref:LamB/YcsF family protein n=1 Tax=Saccharothrix syringae TaxID=103733 RepID=A0A5Q0HDC4_SACSY|nr:5-oxoprolinase subunit PxpA [Saccharothrix syringae]QFZ23840.1 LamB/YcsF family protein [Saccharothrix syringae]